MNKKTEGTELQHVGTGLYGLLQLGHHGFNVRCARKQTSVFVCTFSGDGDDGEEDPEHLGDESQLGFGSRY